MTEKKRINSASRKNMAPYSILTSKLRIPHLHPSFISRRRLVERLDESLERKLTLLAAPPGFGKTTLLSDWIKQRGLFVSWFSIDETDSDIMQFLTYMIAALQTIDKNIGQFAFNLIKSPQLPSLSFILTALINSITEFSREFILVLDDYHLADTISINTVLTFLLDHLPPNMHIVLSTRSDPPLPLSRLRSQNQMLELRAGDLAFTREEMIRFLHRNLDVELTQNDIELLEAKTEGWITGLQLACLSLRGRRDTAQFIKDFKGDNRYIADYLMEEVLTRQPEHIQNFLLHTSILDRLSGSLCDAVTEQINSRQILIDLEKANLFIYSLDSEQNSFRYHRLFSDLLYQRLKQAQPESVAELYRRASEWHLRHGFKDEAVSHALAAQDFDRASNLIEDIAEGIWDREQQSKLLRWFTALPIGLVATKPLLSILQARAQAMSGDPQMAELALQSAENALESFCDNEVELLPDGTSFRREHKGGELCGKISTVRAILATYQGNVDLITQQAQKALDLLPKEERMWRGVAASMLGMAYGWAGTGDFIKARQAFSEARDISGAGGNASFFLFATMGLAAVEIFQGHMREALKLFRKLGRFVKEKGMSETGNASSIQSSIGAILFEMNEIEEGRRLVEESIERAEKAYDWVVLEANRLNLVRVLFSLGEYKETQTIITHIERDTVDFEIPPWMRHRLSSWNARIFLATKNRESANRWMKDCGLNLEDKITHRREAEFLALARILKDQNRLEEADHLLKRMIAAAEAGNRILVVIEAVMIRALILYDQGHEYEALEVLNQALAMAEPGGFIRIFVDEGALLAELLKLSLAELEKSNEASQIRLSRSYVKKLLLAFKAEKPLYKTNIHAELLSDRELEVLQLIAVGLSNQNIAEKLFISLNTVRTHTKNINVKLDVHSRTQAVARAKELGLL